MTKLPSSPATPSLGNHYLIDIPGPPDDWLDPDIVIDPDDLKDITHDLDDGGSSWFINLLRYALRQLADWLVDEVIRPVIQGATWLVEWMRAELRYWTYEGIKWVVEMTETTEGVIVMLALALTAAVVAPELVAKIMSTSVAIFIKQIVEWVKEKTGNLLELIGFVDIVSVHQALMVLWPKWRETFVPFNDAISALSEQLGQGTGYIHAWLSTAHGLSMIGTSLLGLDPEVGELRSVEQSSLFMKTLDEKFRRYAHDPGEIITDIIEDIYIPNANEIRDTHRGLIDSVAETRQYFENLNAAFDTLDAGLQAIIDYTIPEMQEQMAENLKGVRDVIDTYQGWINEYVLPNIDLSIRVLTQRAEWLEQANAVARAKLANPIEIFMATEFQDQATQLATWNYLKEQLGKTEAA